MPRTVAAGRARRAPHVQRSLAAPRGVDPRRAGGHVRGRYPPYASARAARRPVRTCPCSCTSRASRCRTCSSSRSRSRTSRRTRTPRFSSSACTAWCHGRDRHAHGAVLAAARAAQGRLPALPPGPLTSPPTASCEAPKAARCASSSRGRRETWWRCDSCTAHPLRRGAHHRPSRRGARSEGGLHACPRQSA